MDNSTSQNSNESKVKEDTVKDKKPAFRDKLKNVTGAAVAKAGTIKNTTMKSGSDLATSAKESATEVSRKAADVVKAGTKQMADKTAHTLTSVSNAAKSKADEIGISDKVSHGVSAARKTVDVFTGEKQLRLIEERLTLQMRYNDVLATKLDEALTRITELEARIDSHS